MTSRQTLYVVLNTAGKPCGVCGAVLPFLTASPLDPPGATAHAPGQDHHIPLAVASPDEVPSGYVGAPASCFPELGERLYNLSAVDWAGPEEDDDDA